MLTPNIIPDKEPLIRVGIILPEDRYTSFMGYTPDKTDYQIEFSGQCLPLKCGQRLFFKLERDNIYFKLGNHEYRTINEARLYPVQEVKGLNPKDGILVKNVIAGRGFHWKKYIDVNLPDTIIIKRFMDRLLMINELPIERYLMCVATSEMSASCPPALIEAQTIAARSWMLANVEQKHRQYEMDVCNDDCCQRYQGTTYLTNQSVEGALNTYGQVLIFNDKICDARYSKSCGGVSESFETIWEGEPLPYLQVIADADKDPEELLKPLSDENNFIKWIESNPITFCSGRVVPENQLKQYLGSVDEQGEYFRWNKIILQKELTANINDLHRIEAEYILNLKVIKRGGSGRINHLTVEYVDKNKQKQTLHLKSEYSIRQSLHKNFLYSSAFIINTETGVDKIPVQFQLRGAGWGHGVGLCQIGALGMALQNYSAKEIVVHYYPGSVLKRIY